MLFVVLVVLGGIAVLIFIENERRKMKLKLLGKKTPAEIAKHLKWIKKDLKKDARALKEDWQKVGEDFRKVINW